MSSCSSGMRAAISSARSARFHGTSAPRHQRPRRAGRRIGQRPARHVDAGMDHDRHGAPPRPRGRASCRRPRPDRDGRAAARGGAQRGGDAGRGRSWWTVTSAAPGSGAAAAASTGRSPDATTTAGRCSPRGRAMSARQRGEVGRGARAAPAPLQRARGERHDAEPAAPPLRPAAPAGTRAPRAPRARRSSPAAPARRRPGPGLRDEQDRLHARTPPPGARRALTARRAGAPGGARRRPRPHARPRATRT